MKKNVLKKFAAAALAAATVMSSMSVMAFADDTGAIAKTGSVTITKYMGDTTQETLKAGEYTGERPEEKEDKLLKNVEFAYVKVGERVQVDTATSDSSQTEIQYTVKDENFLDAIGIEKAEVNKNFTQKTLNEKVSSSANKTKVINFVNTYKGANKKSTDENGTASFTELDLNALYVFAETDATNAALASDGSKVNVTKVSVPFLVSLPFTGSDGTTVTNLRVYPKNSTGNVDIDKKIDNVEETSVNDIKANANIGDIITYKVTYSVPVPENGLAALQIVDTMSEGLTFTNNKDNIKVVDDEYQKTSNQKELVYGTDYEVTKDGKVVTINFNKYLSLLEKNSTEKFTITYKVRLNENAVLGQTGNKNKVHLEYKNDGEDKTNKTPDKDTTVFTYGIDLTKKGENGGALSGVEFKLTEGEKEITVKKSENAYYPSNGTGASSTVTTDEQGKIYIRGLKPGTYQLKETKTNAGYVLLKEPVKIVITEDSTTPGKATAFVGNKEVTMTDDNESDTAIVPLTVVNSKGFDLPATGGRGIALFTIAGIAIVAAAGSLLFMRKRSK